MAVIVERSRGGRKRVYELDVPMIMYLSGFTKPGEIAKKYKVPVQIITKICDGRYVLEGKELDHKRIAELGLKICQCCRKRIVPLVPIKTNMHKVTLTRLVCFLL